MENKSKKLVFSFLLIATLMISVWGCKKGEDNNEDNTKKNAFTYQGQEYELTKACITLTSDGSLYNFDLELASSGINFNYVDSIGYTQQKGIGNFVYSDLYAINSNFTGNFICDDSGNSNDVPHFEDGIIVMNGNFNNGWPDEIGILDGGTLNINKSDNIYEITFNWTSNEGKIITGYYKGELAFYGFD